MTDLTNDRLTERAVGLYQCLINLGAIDEQSAMTVGEIADSRFNPVPEPADGWPSREAKTRAITGWLRTAVRLGYVRAGKPSRRRRGRWYYWATPSA